MDDSLGERAKWNSGYRRLADAGGMVGVGMMRSKSYRRNGTSSAAWQIRIALCAALFATQSLGSGTVLAQPSTVDLRNALVIVPGEGRDIAEKTAVRVLTEEIQRRTTVTLPVSEKWTADRPVIVVATRGQETGRPLPPLKNPEDPSGRSEGYLLQVETTVGTQPLVWVIGADPRGTLYAVGALLRNLNWGKNRLALPSDLELRTAPAYPIRGHQLGYRAKASSYDALSVEQYEQYIRELAIFGANSIENIPLSDARESPHFKVPRDRMNRAQSEICQRYGLDYWVWMPVEFDLDEKDKRAQELVRLENYYKDTPYLSAIFIPGGDPGDNHSRNLLPFVEELSPILEKYHPKAKFWISMQGFNREEIDEFHAYVDKNQPEWLGGVAAGPSSPPMRQTRQRLPAQYGLRDYPDITHTVRCQYPVPWWDAYYALILGRESSNPRPVFYSRVHRWTASDTDGFVSYSDGVHDDVNKVVWNMLGWEPGRDVRKILIEYARFFFGPDASEAAADGILALEKNWRGPLATNGSVEATFQHWQALDEKFPQAESNWRWALCLLHATYDTLIRSRLLHETELESRANQALTRCAETGADASMDAALAILLSVDRAPVRPELRQRIETLFERLFKHIGLQSSMKRYGGSSTQRGCTLDFIDRPLNNRWWLEDEFKRIGTLASEDEKLAELSRICRWENPGPGSYYDDIGNLWKSPHLDKGAIDETGPLARDTPTPTYWAWDGGFGRQRLSWSHTLRRPLRLLYAPLDPQANYLLRLTGHGEAFPRLNGTALKPTIYNKGDGEIKEFPVPPELISEGTAEVTFDMQDESHLNWRNQSRIAEVWLLKR